MSDQDLYAKLVEAALRDGEISHGLSSGDPSQIHMAIAKALGPEEATPDRVRAIAGVSQSDWQNIRALGGIFGRDTGVN